MKTKLTRLFVALALLALPAVVQAQFTFTPNPAVIRCVTTVSGRPNRSPPVVNRGQNVLTNPINGTQMFFRLH